MEKPENKQVVIACDVLRRQLEALGETPYKFEYLDAGLHRTPPVLTETLQEMINSQSDADLIILGYGLCSRSIVGLRAQSHQIMVVPKIDDCIGLTMGCRSSYYKEFAQNPGSYYFTKGWIEASEDPLKEYHKVVAKYDQETADWTIKEILKHYKRAVLIKHIQEVDEPSEAYVKHFAEFFNLKYEEMYGTLDYVKKLLFGPWDDDFVVVEGGKEITDEMFQNRHEFEISESL